MPGEAREEALLTASELLGVDGAFGVFLAGQCKRSTTAQRCIHSKNPVSGSSMQVAAKPNKHEMFFKVSWGNLTQTSVSEFPREVHRPSDASLPGLIIVTAVRYTHMKGREFIG
jgi:hypothetical protein